MGKLYLIMSFIFIIGKISAQDEPQKQAIFHAVQMANCYNNKDSRKYVDYLAPSQYGNDSANKERYSGMWQSIMRSDTGLLKIAKILKFGIYNNQHQALFQSKFRNNDFYIFGISSNNGQNWFFTQPLSNTLNFESVLLMISTIDTSFAPYVDAKYGKRINYEIGKSIDPFNYTDIHGNILSSDSLKGKVIILNFWSVTCGPCVMEIPELNKLVDKMKGKEVVFIAPSFYASKEMLTDNFLTKHPFNYQIVIINNDDYNVISLPTHIIIDQNLKVIDKIIGYNSENINSLEEKINQILK
jgi:thiol-disulfide isomerase/thioredoxin